MVDINMTEKLISHMPSGYLAVSESGLNNNSDLKKMADLGVNCFLIGEAFMREENIYEAVKKILIPA